MKPANHKIRLQIDTLKMGAIDTDTIPEHGTIVSIGDYVIKEDFPIGATLYFKAWAVDIISKGEDKYYFITDTSDAICAVE